MRLVKLLSKIFWSIRQNNFLKFLKIEAYT
jgi:hypothetical protein